MRIAIQPCASPHRETLSTHDEFRSARRPVSMMRQAHVDPRPRAGQGKVMLADVPGIGKTLVAKALASRCGTLSSVFSARPTC